MTPRIGEAIGSILAAWQEYQAAQQRGPGPREAATLRDVTLARLTPRLNELEAAVLEYQLRGKDLTGGDGPA